MATVEKLKKIIANVDCDPQYHFDEFEPDIFESSSPFEMSYNYIKLAYSNYEHNRVFGISGLIYDQNNEYIRYLRYGIRQLWYNGCEIIAMYNAAYLLDRPLKIEDIILDMEFMGSMLMGEWGTNPLVIGTYMRSKGFGASKISKESMNFCAINGTVFIISFFNNGYNPFSMIHTVTVVCNGINSFDVYNLDPGQNDVQSFKSVDEILSGGGWIVGFKIGIINTLPVRSI